MTVNNPKELTVNSKVQSQRKSFDGIRSGLSRVKSIIGRAQSVV